MENEIKEFKFSKLQNTTLKLMLNKFKKQLINDEDNNGLVKAKFKYCFWIGYNDGYYEIDELVKNNNFESFASEYCIYLVKEYSSCFYSYYELIWDYKTYFKKLAINSQAKKPTNNTKKEICKINGHKFGAWKEKILVTIKENEKAEPIKTEKIKWTRKCNYCGYTQTTSKKPDETGLIEIEKEVKILQRKIGTIKR